MAVKKPKKEIKEENLKKEQEDKNLFAFLATFLSIIGFIIALIVKRDDKYVMYYAKQSLVIFILALIAGSLTAMLGWIPTIGWIISFALNILIIIAWIISWVNALSGKQRTIPIVSYWAKKVDL